MLTTIYRKISNPKILLFLTILVTPWTWYILQKDFFVIIVLIVLNFLLLKTALNYTYIFTIKSAFFILFILLSFYIFWTGFDKKIFITSSIETIQLGKRHEFYAKGFRKLYTNKVGMFYYKTISFPITKIQSNLFSNLDLNLYFFAAHPRERAGVFEFSKYPFFLLPFFICGIFYAIKRKIYILGYYFFITMSIYGFISQSYFLGPILFLPLINVTIVIGALSQLKILKLAKTYLW